eukprot:SAG22_NODE_334_length_12094_cov_9.446019_8_plen_356_part_00
MNFGGPPQTQSQQSQQPGSFQGAFFLGLGLPRKAATRGPASRQPTLMPPRRRNDYRRRNPWVANQEAGWSGPAMPVGPGQGLEAPMYLPTPPDSASSSASMYGGGGEVQRGRPVRHYAEPGGGGGMNQNMVQQQDFWRTGEIGGRKDNSPRDAEVLGGGGGGGGSFLPDIYGGNASSQGTDPSAGSNNKKKADHSRNAKKAVKLIRTILQSRGRSTKQLFQQIDTDHSGGLDFPEMCWYVKNKLHLNFDESTLKEVFDIFSDYGIEITYMNFVTNVVGEDKRDGTSLDTNGAAPREDASGAANANAEATMRKRIRAAAGDLRTVFKVGCKALSFCCASTFSLSKAVPFRAVCPNR